MTKRQKTLYELQYENAKIENDTNKGCAIVGLGFIGFWAVLFLLMFMFAGH